MWKIIAAPKQPQRKYSLEQGSQTHHEGADVAAGFYWTISEDFTRSHFIRLIHVTSSHTGPLWIWFDTHAVMLTQTY